MDLEPVLLFCATLGAGAVGACLWQPAPPAVRPPVREPAAIALDLVAPESGLPIHAKTLAASEDRKRVPNAKRALSPPVNECP